MTFDDEQGTATDTTTGITYDMLSGGEPASEPTITITQERVGTRSPGVDAGGPYGGPNTFEGDTIDLSASADDPSLILIRWDVDGDGVWDYPDETDPIACPSLPCFGTDWDITHTYYDNFIGDLVKVEAWDGFSTYVIVHAGDNLEEEDTVNWIIYPQNQGWKFTAKADLTVTELGYYRWFYYISQPHMVLWDVNTQSEVANGECIAPRAFLSWNWCTLATPATLTAGNEYVMAIDKGGNYYPYMVGTNWGNIEPENDAISISEWVYKWAPYGYPGNSAGSNLVPLVDFKWEWTEVVPLTETDTAYIEVHNVAPVVGNLQVSPTVGFEGSPVEVTGEFSDPGLDDDWWYRVDWGDGSVSDWTPVKKYSGGADVLFLHSLGANYIGSFVSDFRAACGNFCTSFDTWDFGPLGKNTLPTFDELMEYDVVITSTNYFVPSSRMNTLGDMLADFADQKGTAGSGGVVNLAASFWGSDNAGIGGRWDDDDYSALDRAFFTYGFTDMGFIYDPTHPLLNGVSNVNAYYKHSLFGVRTGAVRIVDYTNGVVMGATNENPVVPNGARTVALNWFPGGYALIAGVPTTGDWDQMLYNAVRWTSRQPDPVLLTQPITVGPMAHTYVDDHPTTTTEQDVFDVTLEVKDDDHNLCLNCNDQVVVNEANQGPSDWAELWNHGWNTIDLTGWRMLFQDNRGSPGSFLSPYYDFPDGTQIEPQTSLLLREGGGSDTDDVKYTGFNIYWVQYPPYGGSAVLIPPTGASLPCDFVRWNSGFTQAGCAWGPPDFNQGSSLYQAVYRNQDTDTDTGSDWSLTTSGTPGALNPGQTGMIPQPPNPMIELGLGSASGTATIANVPPVAVNGPTSGLRNENVGFDFEGYQISDPALLEPTEWFAYMWDFDDGTTTPWNYVGSLAPPKLDILFVHTLCAPGTGEGCSFAQGMINALSGLDNVGTVDAFNMFPTNSFSPQSPTLAQMLPYDIIMHAVNYGSFSLSAWNAARIAFGNNLADWMDIKGSGAGFMSFLPAYGRGGFGGEFWTMLGRYIDDDYGAFEKEFYAFGAQSLGTIYEPDHDILEGVSDINTGPVSLHSGDYDITQGGGGMAAGIDGVKIADWGNGNTALGVKELANGARSVNLGAFGGPPGGDTEAFFRAALGWAGGGIPKPDIAPINHVWGDNGIYYTDLIIIDDDMHYVWDFVNNEPVLAPGYSQGILSHNVIPVEVNNVDPLIESISAFVSGDLCMEVEHADPGTVVTLQVFDGTTLNELVIVVPDPTGPDDDDDGEDDDDDDEIWDCMYDLSIDITAPSDAWVKVIYDPTNAVHDDDGDDDDDDHEHEAEVELYWGPPEEDNEETVELEFEEGDGYTEVDIPLGYLLTAGEAEWEHGEWEVEDENECNKHDSEEGGCNGPAINFQVTFSDQGSDDLAVIFDWGDSTPFGIHVYDNVLGGFCGGANELLKTNFDAIPTVFDGCSDGSFVRVLNTDRTPLVNPQSMTDTQSHVFTSPYLYYVMVMVVDDDNTEGYPSTFLTDGIDMEVILIDLR